MSSELTKQKIMERIDYLLKDMEEGLMSIYGDYLYPKPRLRYLMDDLEELTKLIKQLQNFKEDKKELEGKNE